MNKLLCLLLIVVTFPSGGLNSQCSVDTNVLIAEIDTVSLTIDVQGALNDDLSDPSQGLCRVCINFEHEFLGDLSVELISPSGQSIRLLGPVGNFGLTQFSEWDVCFLPSSAVAMPDPGFSDRWANNQLWGSFAGTYTGSYYPFFGSLEDFNVGAVNGTWTLRFVDRTIFYEGRILGFELEFCDDAGLQCKPCSPDKLIVQSDSLKKCLGDPTLAFQLDYTVDVIGDSLDYQEAFFTMDSSGTIISQGTSIDLTNASPGAYSVCGISYFSQHNSHLPKIGSKWPRFIDSVHTGSKSICLGYSNCIEIIVQPPPDTVFIDTILCNTDTLFYKDTFLFQEGRHIVSVDQGFTCDSSYIIQISRTNLDAVILDPDTITCSIHEIILDGSTSTYPLNTILSWRSDAGGDVDTVTTDSLKIDREGEYILILENGACIDSAVVNVVTDSLVPSVTISGDTITCANRSVVLEASSSGRMPNFEWYASSVIIENGSILSIDSGGQYTVVVTDANGCSNTAVYEVIVDTLAPLFSITADSIDCIRDSATIKLSDSSDFLFVRWIGPNNELYNGDSLRVSPPGIYIVEAISVNGCIRTDSVEIHSDLDTPIISLQLDTIDCRSPVVKVIPDIFSGLQFEWYRNNQLYSGDSVLITDSIGDYKVIVFGKNGCTSSYRFRVEREKELLDIELMSDSLKCHAVDPKVWIQNNPSISNPIWTGPSNNQSVGDTMMITEPGWYVITYSAPSGCLYRDSIFAKDYRADFTVQLSADTITCMNPISQINAMGSVSDLNFLWLRGVDTISMDSTWTTTESGEYYLTATDSLGCTYYDTLRIHIDTILPNFQVLGIDTLDCTKTSILLTTDHIGGGSTIIWSDDLGTFLGNSDSLEIFTSGRYEVEIMARNGCADTRVFEIHQDTIKPTVSLRPDTINCDSLSAELLTTGGQSSWLYTWTLNSDTLFGPHHQVFTPGRYNLTVLDTSNGCEKAFSTEILLDTTRPMLILNDTTKPCDQDSLTLGIDNPFGYMDFEWTGPGNFGFLGQNPTIIQPGKYEVTFKSLNGCTGRDSLLILESQLPTASITSDTLTCLDTVAELSIYFTSQIDSFYWLGSAVRNIEDSIFVTDTAAELALVLIGEEGCRDTINHQVELDTTAPAIFLSQVGLLGCNEDKVSLNLSVDSIPGGSYTIDWTDSAFQQISTSDPLMITVNNPGWYFVIVTDDHSGCVERDSLFVDRISSQMLFDSIHIESPTCEGDENGVIEVLTVVGGKAPFLYQIDNLGFDTTAKFDFLEKGDYLITVQDSAGCLLDSVITLREGLVLNLEIGQDTLIDAGDSILLRPVYSPQSAVINNSNWTPNHLLDARPGLNALVFPDETTAYTLTIETEEGCQTSDIIVISVRRNFEVYIPNVITPDQNGLNDGFEVFAGKGVERIIAARIYNRWGGLVFQNSNIIDFDSLIWNGNLKGEKCPTDVYIYIIEILTKSGEVIQLSGDFTLIR